MSTSPVAAKARFSSEPATGDAAVDIAGVSVAGQASTVLLEALSGRVAASIRLVVTPDGRGGAVLAVADVQTMAETVTVQASEITTSATAVHTYADQIHVGAGDGSGIFARVLRVAAGKLVAAAKSVLLAAERRLELTAPVVSIDTRGGIITMDGTRIEMRSPVGQLGVGGLPIARYLFEPFVIDSQGVVCRVQGLSRGAWRSQ